MATYRFLQPAYVAGAYYDAGTTATTADIPGGTLPANWKPTGNVEPVDAAAATAFFNAGPQPLGLIRTQFTTLPVGVPATVWKALRCRQALGNGR
jgi:hypothetical protein